MRGGLFARDDRIPGPFIADDRASPVWPNETSRHHADGRRICHYSSNGMPTDRLWKRNMSGRDLVYHLLSCLHRAHEPVLGGAN